MLQDGETALHKPAMKGHVEVVKTLIDCGAAVDIRNKVYTISALLYGLSRTVVIEMKFV